MSRSDAEFASLRQVIAARGTVRVVLVPITFLGWGALITTGLLWGALPILALVSLAVLAAGFEAIHALHVGAERIGRYLQVFYEGPADGPQWETTAMKVGPALPGGGIDPLFTVLFALAAVLNLLPGLLPAPTPLELAVIGGFHAAFLVRLLRARLAAARQRAVELESYRALRQEADDRGRRVEDVRP